MLHLTRMESKVPSRFGNDSCKSSSGSETLSEGEIKAIGNPSVCGHIDDFSQNSSDSETQTERKREGKSETEDSTEEGEAGSEEHRDYAEEDEDELISFVFEGRRKLIYDRGGHLRQVAMPLHRNTTVPVCGPADGHKTSFRSLVVVFTGAAAVLLMLEISRGRRR